MHTVARFDRSALATILAAAIAVPCIAEKVGGLSQEEISERLADWTVLGFYRGAECIGGCIYRASEGHIAVLPEHKHHWANKQTVKAVVDLWRSDGRRVATTVDSRNEEGLRFVRKLGLEPIRENGNSIRFEGYL